MARRGLPMIALLAALLHGVGIARSALPAQDGLKFLRVARQFHSDPWIDVVRGSDQHPLYPALIATSQPIVSAIVGPGEDSWRIAAQVVSAVASIALIFPLFALTRSLFDEATAVLAALLFVLLPLPSAVGHDTLSDPLALLAFTTAFALGESALRTRRLDSAIACGVASGLGFLARPEVAVVPFSVALAGILGAVRSREIAIRYEAIRGGRRLAGLSVAFLALVGSYTVVKGEVSEKLSLRWAAALPSAHDAPALVERSLPAGLNDPRWDFAAKEESDHPPRLGLLEAIARFVARYSEAMGYVLVPLAAWGAWRLRAGVGARLVAVYALVFSGLLSRHAMTFGYLSARHTFSLVIVALPFASAAILAMARGVRARLEARGADTPANRTIRRSLAVAAILALAVGVQLHRPPHPSRWGHGAAGRWLADRASAREKVLDTRGWATFVSGRPAHDYWHVRQALMDPALSYVVVGEDERTASSRRGETLRAILAYAAEPAAEFPEREGGPSVGVRVYRFRPPTDWRGMRP